MLKRDVNKRIVLFQDDSAKNPVNTYDFVEWMNSVVRLFDSKYEDGPARHYENAMIQDTDRYNNYQDLMVDMAKQFTYLCGKLKTSGLPVIMPDYPVFKKEFERIKKLDDHNFRIEMQKEATLFETSLKISIEQNKRTAIAHKIPVEKPIAPQNTINK